MAIWIGVDEAGYGPNLGPLVICATVWETAEGFPTHDWATQLAGVFRRVHDEAGDSDRHLVVDDSKLVYQSGKGLAALERNVLALLRLCGASPADVDELRACLDAEIENSLNELAWRRAASDKVPSASEQCFPEESLRAIADAMKVAGIQIKTIAGRLVFPRDFNRRLEKHDNKAAVLSEATMQLICDLLRAVEGEDVLLHCDKHGGRDRYFALLTHFFPDERIEILCEGEQESAYRWRTARNQIEIHFCAKGERHLPTAAASMTAKYARELCMAEWNAFWQSRVPGLAPTAGYPLDARRFRKAIESQVKELGWEESHYWRLK
jgi:hypothetical protein